jgi:protein phosphatase
MRDYSRVLEMSSLTHPGMVRGHNEDCVATDVQHGFVVLADGMGGYNAGEVASGIAVAMMVDGLRQELEKGIVAEAGEGENPVMAMAREQAQKANHAIFQTAQSQPGCAGMGTTLVAAIFHDNKICVAHVGDSRLYRLRGEAFEQVTRDHSLLQEQLDSGMITPEEAKLSHNKNLVTRALGVDPEVEVEVHEYEALQGDIYLFCSDGLNDMVEDEDIGLALATMGSNLPLAAEQLVQMANDNGGRDNVSVVLARVVRPFSAKRGWFARFLEWLK